MEVDLDGIEFSNVASVDVATVNYQEAVLAVLFNSGAKAWLKVPANVRSHGCLNITGVWQKLVGFGFGMVDIQGTGVDSPHIRIDTKLPSVEKILRPEVPSQNFCRVDSYDLYEVSRSASGDAKLKCSSGNALTVHCLEDYWIQTSRIEASRNKEIVEFEAATSSDVLNDLSECLLFSKDPRACVWADELLYFWTDDFFMQSPFGFVDNIDVQVILRKCKETVAKALVRRSELLKHLAIHEDLLTIVLEGGNLKLFSGGNMETSPEATCSTSMESKVRVNKNRLLNFLDSQNGNAVTVSFVEENGPLKVTCGESTLVLMGVEKCN